MSENHDSADPEEHRLPFLLAGVGTSGRRVEACLELFRALPEDTGMAFVLIPPVAAASECSPAVILARHTAMPVTEIAEGVRPEPDHVYVAPPDSLVRIENGVFHIDRAAEGTPCPIDYFFLSLAANQKNRAVGVVLSGTAVDGAIGLKAIRDEGGIAMVESPEAARIAAELANLGRRFLAAERPRPNAVQTQTAEDLSNLLNSMNLPVLLRAPDIGRPLSEIRLNLAIDELQPLLTGVLETLTPRELEVQDREGHWYLLRARPHRTSLNRIEGVVVSLIDIDHLRRARDFAEAVIESIRLPLAVVDPDWKIRAANLAFRGLAGLGKGDVLDEPLRSHLKDLKASHQEGKEFGSEYRQAGETPKVFEIFCRMLKPEDEVLLLVTFGDITAYKEAERRLSHEQERLSSEVAALSRELDRTQDELRALAGSLFTSQEDERRRVARELHDDIGQKLAVFAIGMQKAEERISQDPAQAQRELVQVRAAVGSLSEEVRRISHALHPAVIDDLGIAPALRSLVEDFRVREHMIATFSAQDLPHGIPNRIATGLYRIAQEALRNIAKHAGKTHVRVTVRACDDGLRLQVQDSGAGFDPHGPRTGLGLISMEERARNMEGRFGIESEIGVGTRITVDVPLPAAGG